MDTGMVPGICSDEPKLILAEGATIGFLWPVLSDYFSFLENDVPQLYTMQSLLDLVLDKKMQLWGIEVEDCYVAAGLTQVIQYPVNTILEIVGWGGKDSENWLLLIERLALWGEMQGCTVVRAIGRKGWTRLLKDYNFNGEKVVISAPITECRR